MTHRRMIPASGARWMMNDGVKRLKAHLCWNHYLNKDLKPRSHMYVAGCSGGLFPKRSMVPYDGSRPKCKVCSALEVEWKARLEERFPNCQSCRDLRDLLREVTEACAGDYEVLEHLDDKLRRKVKHVLSPYRPFGDRCKDGVCRVGKGK